MKTNSQQIQQCTKLNDSERTRCEVWTRVMGYHRPLTSFNPGKQSEHEERQFFSEKQVH